MPVPVGFCFSAVFAAEHAKTGGAACVLRFDVGTRTEASRETAGMDACGLRSGADLRLHFTAPAICRGLRRSSFRFKFEYGRSQT